MISIYIKTFKYDFRTLTETVLCNLYFKKIKFLINLIYLVKLH